MHAGACGDGRERQRLGLLLCEELRDGTVHGGPDLRGAAAGAYLGGRVSHEEIIALIVALVVAS
ncbi:hypothetical protein GCM10010423_57690 [Streptomyces levis]|uniref:Uncharacterized protein n=1 Tax=Streptomyces levis TaxID=285566 RepID=A0ABN3P0J0_9ACTN